ncbi:MAG: hypothetical protein KDK38_02615 [Leptospiraceae bacterium]|nr:hypothetical protein [Leptospiraceae bacterium]
MSTVRFAVLFFFFCTSLFTAPLRHPNITPEFLESLKPDYIDEEFGFEKAKYKIENREGWLWALGPDLASKRNNEALSFVQANDMKRARSILEETKLKSPQNVCVRYNLGRVYLFFRQHNEALTEFRKASLIMPQYWMNFFYVGRSYELIGDNNEAVYYYRLAYRKNPYDLVPLTYLGDLLLSQNRLAEAERVYRYCLRQDDGFNDALIGMGKLNYLNRRYYDAVIWFRMVETNRPYKKELHFYYGESAYYSRMYPVAVEEFQAMLNYPQDAIFEKVSLGRVRFRLGQARRLSLQSDQ